ncbi:MAG: hypothetical protein A2452_13130 [Candidatus Firestonebacteria bacterium RIFOXYC2_FULL_39_67]|nr:MAG: hypothetical protein A2452_13130 [Candidatus Firestonebacteria bacterium RIFOXYC2_FULL_39_67]
MKRNFAWLFVALFFTSCAANKDIIRSIPEDARSKVTVSTELVSMVPPVTKEHSMETTLMSGAPVIIPNVPYKKYSALSGIDWNKQVQFSFKDEDIVKLFDFLTKASGLTIVNVGAEVAADLQTDPQTQSARAQAQPYYGGQAQQEKRSTSKKIGPASGNVTVYSKGSITLEQAFKILDSVLMGKGYCSLFVGDVLKIVPIDGIRQLNIPVVVNNDPELATDGDEVVSQIIFLKNLTATKLRSDLAALIPSWGLVMSNEAANSIIVINSLSNIKSLLKIIDNLEKASIRATGVSVFRLKYADSKTLSDVLNSVFLGVTPTTAQQQQSQRQQVYGNRGIPAPDEENITIVAETKSNSVVAVAAPQTLALIKSTIEQLDQMQRQVLVEVLVVDVTLNSEFQLGVEFNIDSAPLDFGGRRLDNSSGVLNSNLGLAGKTPTFNYTLLQGNTKLFLHNLMSQTKVDVKAAPRILTLDNQKAVVNVGQQVPNLTGSQTTSSGQVIYTYNYNTVGTILTVTPHINSDDFITMDISQVVSKITQTTFFGAPVVDNRQASTSVRVKDGETMILGGIITESVSTTENKIPILGDIPLLGLLFKYQDQIKEKTELMLFLTPHIIDNSKEADNAVKRMNKKLENIKE